MCFNRGLLISCPPPPWLQVSFEKQPERMAALCRIVISSILLLDYASATTKSMQQGELYTIVICPFRRGICIQPARAHTTLPHSLNCRLECRIIIGRRICSARPPHRCPLAQHFQLVPPRHCLRMHCRRPILRIIISQVRTRANVPTYNSSRQFARCCCTAHVWCVDGHQVRPPPPFVVVQGGGW